MGGLYEQLSGYGDGGFYPFHMPGHKRNQELLPMGNPYGLDITEIPGFDNLHHADGILKTAMERCAGLYGARESFFVVNGSTGGILAGIAACTKRGERILMARNCHKSVYHALYLNGLVPVYLYPPVVEEYGINGGISPEMTEKMLISCPDIRLVVITSPTYEGIVSDVEAIAAAVHRRGALLLVDEAHGAHFGFHKGFPQSAVRLGADLIVQSVHKTLPAFTQSALLHINGREADAAEVKKQLSIYQSSSPSYLLMAGMDRCMELVEKEGEWLFEQWNRLLEEFYEKAAKLANIRVRAPAGNLPSLRRGGSTKMEHIYDIDKSKIILSLRNCSMKNITMTGSRFYGILLQEYALVLEAAFSDYVLAMTGLGDRREGVTRLLEALCLLDEKLESKEAKPMEAGERSGGRQEAHMVMPPCEAWDRKKVPCALRECAGRIAGEFVFLYPPGTPVLVPGESIGEACIERLCSWRNAGLSITGLDEKEELLVLL